MRKAIVAITPQVWYAWWNCSSLGYIIAASMMIHQPVKNCTRVQCQRNTLSSGITGYKKRNKIYWHTRTPAAMEAMVFLFSPQSTLHSQSPHLIPSRNPDILLIWPDPPEKYMLLLRCSAGFHHKRLFTFLDDEVNLSYSHRFRQRNYYFISNIEFWNTFPHLTIYERIKLIKTKVSVKSLIMIQNISISNKWCSFSVGH